MTLDGVTSFSLIKNIQIHANALITSQTKFLAGFLFMQGGNVELSEGYTGLLVVSCVLESR